jgi:hypothetical protein
MKMVISGENLSETTPSMKKMEKRILREKTRAE